MGSDSQTRHMRDTATDARGVAYMRGCPFSSLLASSLVSSSPNSCGFRCPTGYLFVYICKGPARSRMSHKGLASCLIRYIRFSVSLKRTRHAMRKRVATCRDSCGMRHANMVDESHAGHTDPYMQRSLSPRFHDKTGKTAACLNSFQPHSGNRSVYCICGLGS